MKIIKHPHILRSNYIPDKLIFREDLIKDVKLKLEIGTGNILLHGDTGSGKTAAIKNATKDENNSIVVFCNCVSYNTFASITKKIIESIKPNHNYKERGKSIAILSRDLKKVLTTKRTKKILFVFDEVDKLINKERDHQQILGVISELTDGNIILISNDTNALKNLDSRIESRLSPEKRFVRQYFFDEIFEILKARAKEGLEKGSYDVEAIAKISKWVYQTSGDIREALNLLYEISSLAEKRNCRITPELFEEAKQKVGEIEFDEVFAGLPDHQKIIIAGVAKLSSEENEGFSEHKNLYNFYGISVENHGWKSVQFRQFERLLKKLEIRRIIEIRTISPKNRRGRLVVSFPKFDVKRFMDQYFTKYCDINDNAHGGGEDVR